MAGVPSRRSFQVRVRVTPQGRHHQHANASGGKGRVRTGDRRHPVLRPLPTIPHHCNSSLCSRPGSPARPGSRAVTRPPVPSTAAPCRHSDMDPVPQKTWPVGRHWALPRSFLPAKFLRPGPTKKKINLSMSKSRNCFSFALRNRKAIEILVFSLVFVSLLFLSLNQGNQKQRNESTLTKVVYFKNCHEFE